MKISEVESCLGLSAKSIRFYEEEGLITPKRLKNGYRDYSQDDVNQLMQIKLCRQLGISIQDLKKILNTQTSIKTVLNERSEQLSDEIMHLKEMKKICDRLRAEEEPLAQSGSYLHKIENLKERGIRFMNIRKDG
ncbi:MAG: MerR family transcriptional regulator, partial [Turicibacter sp.]